MCTVREVHNLERGFGITYKSGEVYSSSEYVSQERQSIGRSIGG